MYHDWEEGKGAAAGGTRKKSKTLKTRKSLGKQKKTSREESDDEFQPTNATQKAKPVNGLNETRKRVTKVKPQIPESDDQLALDERHKMATSGGTEESVPHTDKKRSPKRELLVF
jgi:hypothetical protein